ncbi:MAG: tetratricopeptide repeat protein [Bryobacterales bacterium]|nr:tetratricopeptide repeat protein [Bryobacterales bacterium]
MSKKLLLLWVISWPALAAAQGPSDLQRAWALADEARQHARSGGGEGESAIGLYEQALELAPEAAGIRRDYATVLGWMGRYVDASREFARVRELEPNQPLWAVREMANADFFGGAPQTALAGFDQILAAGHYEEAVLTRRGLTLLRLGRTEEAEAQYRQALGWYPESEPAAEGLGRALAAQGRLDDAYTLAVTWGASAAEDSDIRILAAEMLSKLGRYGEAAEAFDRIGSTRLEENGRRDLAAEAHRLAGTAPPRRQGLTPAIGVVDAQPANAADSLREQGVQAARAGNAQQGLEYLEQSIRLSPQSLASIRDYAIVLGWSERYTEALGQFQRLLDLEPQQPVWARSELARAQLFGGSPAQALETLDGLIAEGQVDLPTLSRRGLALRWVGRSEEATAAYRRIWKEFPDSPEGARGVVQSLADRNHLGDALDAAERGLEQYPDDADLRFRQAQTLNWAGRHIQARRALDLLPAAYQQSADVLQHRTLAARWASRPREAFELALASRRLHPDNAEAERLLDELSNEYGPSVQASAELVRDSLGYSYHSMNQTVTMPLSVSHRFSLLRERRSYEDRYTDPQSMAWTRYGAGWTGVLGNRITADANVSSLDYGIDGAGRRLLGEASVSALLNDKINLAAGFGMAPAETLPALRERLTARGAWSSVRLRPTIKLEAAARYTHRDFGGLTVRQTFESSAFYRISQRGGHKIRVGGRSQWMWHDRSTALLWSPTSYYNQLAALHFEGRLPGRVDYTAEVGSGFQHEAGFGRQHPLVTTLELAKKVNPHVWLRMKTGYSNSSIDRLNSSTGGYRFGYFSFGLDIRPGRKG